MATRTNEWARKKIRSLQTIKCRAKQSGDFEKAARAQTEIDDLKANGKEAISRSFVNEFGKPWAKGEPVAAYAARNGFDISALPVEVTAQTFVQFGARITAKLGQCRTWRSRVDGRALGSLIQIHKNVAASGRHETTFLHEVAHAWNEWRFTKSMCVSAHGAEWKHAARQLGLRNPQACCSAEEAHGLDIGHKRQTRRSFGECERCGTPLLRTRAPKWPVDMYYHKKCGGKFRAL